MDRTLRLSALDEVLQLPGRYPDDGTEVRMASLPLGQTDDQRQKEMCVFVARQREQMVA